VGGAGSQKREQVLRREQGSRVNRVSRSFFLESGGKDENEWTGALIGPEPK
jgi:hypothetical protein